MAVSSPCPLEGCPSVCVCVLISSSSKDPHPGGSWPPPPVTSCYLNHLFKVVISKQHHFLRFWILALAHRILWGTKSSHVSLLIAVASQPCWRIGDTWTTTRADPWSKCWDPPRPEGASQTRPRRWGERNLSVSPGWWGGGYSLSRAAGFSVTFHQCNIFCPKSSKFSREIFFFFHGNPKRSESWNCLQEGYAKEKREPHLSLVPFVQTPSYKNNWVMGK